MSSLFRLLRHSRLLKGRPLASAYIAPPCFQPKLSMTTTPKQPNSSKPDQKKQDNIEYTVEFKKTDIKKIFKEFYSLYGPLFVACHITVSLVSLGFFSSIVWLTVDPIQYIPEKLASRVGETMMNMTGSGGKFVIAYAIHKLILPVRLGGAIWLTRLLAKKIKLKNRPTVDKKD